MKASRISLVILAVAGSAALTGAVSAVTACDPTDPAPVVSLGDSGLPGSGPLVFIRSDGTQVVAPPCPATVGPLFANGLDTGTLRLDTLGQWTLQDGDSLPVRISTTDALVTLSSSGNGNTSDASAPSGGIGGALSASSPTLDVSVRAGLVPGTTRLTVSAGRFTQDVCLELASNPVAALGLTVSPIDGTDSGAYTVTATVYTTDGNPPSFGTAVGWGATNCAAFSSPRTVVTDGGATTNTLYVPPGWMSTALTASFQPRSPDAGPLRSVLCLTPGGPATPLADGGCPALVVSTSGEAGTADAGDAGDAEDARSSPFYPCTHP